MLVEYDQHGKIKGGDPERMVDDSAAAYVALTVDGTDTLLIAGHALRRGTVPPAPGPAWPAPATACGRRAALAAGPHTLWSRARSANYEALKLFQAAGLTRFAPVKPQRRVIASFDHHCGPHGQPSTLKVIRGGRRENWEDLFNHADQCRSAGLSGSFVLR